MITRVRTAEASVPRPDGWWSWPVSYDQDMMKFSKSLLTVLAVIAALVFLGVMVYDVIQINQLHAVANANRSTEFLNPRDWVLIGAALGLLSGFLFGVALAMPDKTFEARYAERRKAEAIDEAEKAGYRSSTAVQADEASEGEPTRE